jgi:hypothetical protein
LFSDRIAAIREEDGWVVAVENHERLGPFDRYENLPSPTVTIAWSARGRALLHYSDEGRLLVMLAPQSPDRLSGAEPSVLDEHLGGLRLGPTGSRISCTVSPAVIRARMLAARTTAAASYSRYPLAARLARSRPCCS